MGLAPVVEDTEVLPVPEVDGFITKSLEDVDIFQVFNGIKKFTTENDEIRFLTEKEIGNNVMKIVKKIIVKFSSKLPKLLGAIF